MPCRYFGYDCSTCHPIEDCPRVKEKSMPTEKRETRPENLKVGDKVTMTTSRIEVRTGVVTEVNTGARTVRIREEGQMDGVKWQFDAPTVNNRTTVTSRTFAVELEPWQDGDVAMNPANNNAVRFLEGDTWVDAFGAWQANKGAKSTGDFVAIVRGGKPVPRD